MKPEIMRRMVVFPQPEGPRNEKNSPGLMRNVYVIDGTETAEITTDIVELDGRAHTYTPLFAACP